MKTLVLLLTTIVLTTNLFAQKPAAYTTAKITVNGNCEMCKNTIEKAAKKAGATYANWNSETLLLTVKFNKTNKTATEKIQQKIASVGYDTEQFTATDSAYNQLHGCCQYERKKLTPAKKATSSVTKVCAKETCCNNNTQKVGLEDCCANTNCDSHTTSKTTTECCSKDCCSKK